MPETFLILLSGGVMLASAVPRPADVTLNWLRLTGILAFAFFAGAIVFLHAAGERPAGAGYALVATGVAILAQLAFAQLDFRATQRRFALLAALSALVAGIVLLPIERMLSAPSALAASKVLGCLGVETLAGLVLMDMLLGHAYLTAPGLSMGPFRRLSKILAGAIAARALAVALALWMQHLNPLAHLWGRYGLLIFTRWGIGLVVPFIFVAMARKCIDLRANQSATGILYVTGVLIFLGEIIALHLLRATALCL